MGQGPRQEELRLLCPGAGEAIVAVEIEMDVLVEPFLTRDNRRTIGGKQRDGIEQGQMAADAVFANLSDQPVDARVGAKRQGVFIACPLEMLLGGNDVGQAQKAVAQAELHFGETRLEACRLLIERGRFGEVALALSRRSL